jgi:adenosylmethionine-8-amino-7-oxononanoate aminotransferase
MKEFHPNILYYNYEWDYPKLERGKGAYLYDAQGNDYLDGSAGAISVSLGHGREDMAKVVYDQTLKMAYIHRDIATADIADKAAEHMHKCFGYDRFFMVSGGSEAVEIAGKIARLHFVKQGKLTKHLIIGRWMSYHGYTGNAIAYGGNPARRKDYVAEMSQNCKIAPPYCYRCWYGQKPESCRCECAHALETEILMRGPENVAAFIFEPVVGTSLGGAVAPERYYHIIREICDKYDVLMIADEVMCGSGRTGTWNAMEHFGVKADIASLAKSISGGYYPAGAAACTARVAEPIVEGKHFSPGFTWSGNPVASAVIDKTLSVIEDEHLLDNVRRQGVYLKRRLTELKKRHPCIGDVRGLGLMIGLEFVKDPETKECFPPELHFGTRVEEQCRKHRMLTLGTARFDKGVRGDGIMVGPNFESGQKEMDRIVDTMDKALTGAEALVGAD